ncbi:hypothetical protein HCX48_05840 [Rhodocyclus tenuis]|uniref:Oligosaccharide flippase family protein n=1 Tax=Rhodocyclus gracilis TaxID=2929842 RepID=A0ABX0WHC0_9RHOO|nr:hypothetical protein [Rhodocyclus gracilis]NJA88745.1 hypothetical protein [Rhodocyclus gracilis]
MGTFALSPRLWTMTGNLATRGAGFVTSLIISRLLGVNELGVYSGLINTATAVSNPFAVVVTNNSTLLASQAKADTPAVLRASFLIAGLLACVSSASLALIYQFGLSDASASQPLLVAAGVAVVLSQVVGGVALGFLYGRNEFAWPSKTAIFFALVTLAFSYLVVRQYALAGAFLLLIILSLGALVTLSTQAIRAQGTAPDEDHSTPAHIVATRYLRSAPSVLSIAINSGVNWVCTIYLVDTAYGAAGIGVVAVAGQWMNLIMLPATSWGGVTLKSIADAINDVHHARLREVTWALMRKNLTATLALAAGIGLTSSLIAHAYNLADTDLARVICLNCLCALVAAANNVLERLLLALDRQNAWLAFSLVGFSVQLAVTYCFIGEGVWMVAVGVFAGSTVLMLLAIASTFMSPALASREAR